MKTRTHTNGPQPGGTPAMAENARTRGLKAAEAQDWDAAVDAFSQAVNQAPRDPLHRLNLANALLRAGLPQDAHDETRRVLEASPSAAIAAVARQIAASAIATHGGRAAIATMADDASLDPVLRAQAASALAHELVTLGRPHEAMDRAMAALAVDPTMVDAHLALGFAMDRLGMVAQAAQCLGTAALLCPDDALLLSSALHTASKVGDWADADARFARVVALLRGSPVQRVNPFACLALPFTPEDRLEISRRFAAYICRNARPLPPATPRDRTGERIRVGYLSTDFQDHATAYLMVRVLELHDTTRFHVHLYSSTAPRPDSGMQNRVRAAGHAWADVLELDDETLARRIRDDGIDVLVDLNAWTRGSRAAVLAWHPAPVQVQYLGYPGSTGSPHVHYAIVDETVAPEAHAGHFSESLAWMPHTYQPTDDARAVGPPATRAQAGLPEDAFVFCCFNAAWKLPPAMFARWARILARAPGSVLWLMAESDETRRNHLATAAAVGIDPARIVFAGWASQAEHLARLALADLVLDTLPYNAHTTASDALWMGVPVLTRIGDAFAGRVAASLLRAAGLPELVTDDDQSYEDTAVALASRPPGFDTFRAGLAARTRASPLFDSAGCTRALESLYEQMHARAVAGDGPAHLHARPFVPDAA